MQKDGYEWVSERFCIYPQEITIKIRTMDKEFEIKINRTLTIRALKEKIQEVNLISHLLYNY